MSIRWPVPRLLHLTIAALAIVLVVKSADIVRAAAPNTAPTTAPSPPAAPGAKPASEKPAEKPAADAPAAPPPAPQAVSDAERALLQDLRQRRTELEGREAAITMRENVLASTEKRLAARVEELTGLQKRLEALEADRRKHDEANWTGLVKVYENMKPREAANIFNDLDMNVLLPVLDRMKEPKAAAVLAAMQPERARLATADLAQLRSKRNAAPATP